MSGIDVQGLLAKARWRQELDKRGYEGRLPVASERLSEALRTELRAILDNDGKPFDLQVARHVYDFAIAAKDLLTVSVKSVEDAMKVVADNSGAMESLTGPNDPPTPEQASETFGARMLRELLALLPSALHKQSDDPLAVVAAIADARARGMPDLAARLEQKLVGTPLERPKIAHAEVVHDSYEHGFVDGSMQDNFDRGTVDGVVGRDPGSWSPAYREGYEAGRARRQRAAVPVLPVTSTDVDSHTYGSEAGTPIGSFERGFADGSAGLDPTSDTADYRIGYDRGLHQRGETDPSSTWVCGHGKRFPAPAPGSSIVCGCAVTASGGAS